ncbi:uncharacterized protein DUF5107 [Scopulibacillus darangshiensis]|uniref:Uncharacterized protein DUF5107 n=1 Tax=Scopulibacillus darangshiensis TaxID=442528 RepID=A0A4R2P7T6_9BACL|nr:DUF5107 domain-containing protein [Scopulibacillus darangshiensis]TCP30962.1 uncharacterized protein DUF5107 [Scopulibacillus darangshiensis]
MRKNNPFPSKDVTIQTSEREGFLYVSIENKNVKAEILPEIGGKVTSLYNKVTDREWLLDSGKRELQSPEYGSMFTEWDMSGLDDMFPTIDACMYPADGNFKDIPLQDHGEVWSLPWAFERTNDSVSLVVKGKALPYVLQKTYYFLNKHTIRCEYKVENLSDETLVYLWASHPQFKVDETIEILLPEKVQTILSVQGGKKLGTTNQLFNWPTVVTEDGQKISLNQIGPYTNRDSRKLYVPEKLCVSWSALYASDTDDFLLYKTSPNQVPYLGVWVDEGEFNSRATCALEPSTGFYDNLENAFYNGTYSSVKGKGSSSWFLDIVIDSGPKEKMSIISKRMNEYEGKR